MGFGSDYMSRGRYLGNRGRINRNYVDDILGGDILPGELLRDVPNYPEADQYAPGETGPLHDELVNRELMPGFRGSIGYPGDQVIRDAMGLKDDEYNYRQQVMDILATLRNGPIAQKKKKRKKRR